MQFQPENEGASERDAQRHCQEIVGQFTTLEHVAGASLLLTAFPGNVLASQ